MTEPKCKRCGGRIVPATISITGHRGPVALRDMNGKLLDMCAACRLLHNRKEDQEDD